MKHKIILSIFAALSAFSMTAYAQVNIAFSTIGDSGNANDNTGYGGVSYDYAIGTYDVTVGQYCTFLNAVAATDTYSLYNTNMTVSPSTPSITRSGVSGSYSYSVNSGANDNPITYVSWFNAARFTNWLGNGQKTGSQDASTTETGAYSLNGAMFGSSFTKNVSAQYWIPTENEWYKAAYYDPSLNGGNGGYYLYTTRSNTAPGASWANRTLANQANFWTSAPLIGPGIYLTPVGSFTNSASAYGTFDQGGDVFQFNDSVNFGSLCGARGGSWTDVEPFLQSNIRYYFNPTFVEENLGFRVATVPEPTVLVSLVVGMAMLACVRRID